MSSFLSNAKRRLWSGRQREQHCAERRAAVSCLHFHNFHNVSSFVTRLLVNNDFFICYKDNCMYIICFYISYVTWLFSALWNNLSLPNSSLTKCIEQTQLTVDPKVNSPGDDLYILSGWELINYLI